MTNLPTVLPANFLMALPMRLKMFANSGNPVTGLMVPEPPRFFSMRASAGVMCASMVSPLRP
jgi:hypothetical protein